MFRRVKQVLGDFVIMISALWYQGRIDALKEDINDSEEFVDIGCEMIKSNVDDAIVSNMSQRLLERTWRLIRLSSMAEKNKVPSRIITEEFRLVGNALADLETRLKIKGLIETEV